MFTKIYPMALAGQVFLLFALAPCSFGQTDVLMRQYNPARTGANLHETVITPATLANGSGGKTFQKLFDLKVDEKVECQPLIMRNVALPSGIADVVFIATMNNSVFAFDANSGAPIWKSKQLAVPVPDSTSFDMFQTNTNWGILGTPVIDRDTALMYLVSWGLEGGQKQYRLHALDTKTGIDRWTTASNPGVLVGGVFKYIDTDGVAKKLFFNPARQKQRPGLLLTSQALPGGSHKILYVAFGALGEKLQQGGSQNNSHGWVFAYDVTAAPATRPNLPAIWTTTPRIFDGGIWQAGSGPAADQDGNVYVLTGNGSFDGTADFAESFVKLRFHVPTGTQKRPKLSVVDFFTPFRDNQRANDPDHQDRDLGSAGPTYLPDLNMVAGGGKDGIIYLVNRASMGHNAQGINLGTVATYTPAPGIDPRTIGKIDIKAPDGKSHHVHGAPVYWHPTGIGPVMYVWGENEVLRTFSVTGNTLKPLAKAPDSDKASRNMPPPGGMPGGFLSLSANGADPATGIIWGTAPLTGDANMGRDADASGHIIMPADHSVDGVLRAYDAVHFDTSVSPPRLRLLWSSETNHARDSYGRFSKFCPPTIANGKAYVPTFSNKVVVYGFH